MARLTVIGVRHHSPACARLVRETIRAQRPRFVLIEGPSDMNERLGELLLGHQLPIALYTYRLREGERGARGTWSPFCDYSPEWVALEVGRQAGAEVLFIDLPAWHEAFARTENRYADEHLAVSTRLHEVAASLGFDSVDTLWDHLFEQPRDAEVLRRDLDRYFEALRADEPASHEDVEREACMAQWIAWAMAEARPEEAVLVVCGGFHKPALERAWPAAPPARPALEAPAERVGSYLVPFSYRRLDSFSGYASGMPSPAYYQAVWERGEAAAETMAFRTVTRLRNRGQHVSTAEVVAATELTAGLARLRGHALPLRADVLDGLLGALVKEALTKPAPWSMRGALLRGTDPILVEMVAAFSGDARGKLAEATPRPPLVADVAAALEAVGLSWSEEPRTMRLDVFDVAEVPRRQLLYRLLILAIPGVELLAVPDLRRGAMRAFDEWRLQHLLETEPALIERAVYGATVAEAAAARVLEQLEDARDVGPLVLALERALFAGFRAMAEELALRARAAIEREPMLGALGGALGRLLLLARARTGDAAPSGLTSLVEVTCERALWLLEGLDGRTLPFAKTDVDAVVALRNAVRDLDGALTLGAEVRDVFARRAAAAEAPPAIRGACLGALWSLRDRAGGEEALAVRTSGAIPTRLLGDFLSGLFGLAREELLGSSLIDAIDARLAALGDDEFLTALPSLRRAFAFFPPRERLLIAKRVVAAHGAEADAGELLRGGVAAASVQRGAALESAVFRAIDAHGLLGGSR
jgi:hypothetical protein